MRAAVRGSVAVGHGTGTRQGHRPTLNRVGVGTADRGDVERALVLSAATAAVARVDGSARPWRRRQRGRARCRNSARREGEGGDTAQRVSRQTMPWWDLHVTGYEGRIASWIAARFKQRSAYSGCWSTELAAAWVVGWQTAGQANGSRPDGPAANTRSSGSAHLWPPSSRRFVTQRDGIT